MDQNKVRHIQDQPNGERWARKSPVAHRTPSLNQRWFTSELHSLCVLRGALYPILGAPRCRSCRGGRFFFLCRKMNKSIRYMNCQLSAPREAATSFLPSPHIHLSNCHEYMSFAHPSSSSPFQMTTRPLLCQLGSVYEEGGRARREWRPYMNHKN